MKRVHRLSALLITAVLCIGPASAHSADGHAVDAVASPSAITAGVKKIAARKHSAEADRRADQTRPFDFRGIPLGMSLDAFLASGVARATPSNSRPLCDTDVAAADVGLDFKSDQSLTVACRWAHRAGNSWQVSRAVVAGSLAQDHVLRFVKLPGQTTFHLYEISLVVDEVTANDLRDGLTSRFGAPNKAAPSTVAASAGGGALRVYTWENAVSTITLCFLPQTHNGTLTYVLKAPDMWLKSMVQEWQSAGFGTG